MLLLCLCALRLLLRLRPLRLSLLGLLPRLFGGLRALLRLRLFLLRLCALGLLRLRLFLLHLWALGLLHLRPLWAACARCCTCGCFCCGLWALGLLHLRPLLLGLLSPRLLHRLRVLLRLRRLWALRLRLRLWALLLRGCGRGVLFGFALLAALRVGRGQRPEKQKQRAGGGNSNELHDIHLR